MASKPLDTLFAHLTDVESLDKIAAERLDPEVIPSEPLRRVFEWVMRYYYESGRRQAPSVEAILEGWGETLSDNDQGLGDGTEEDTVEWAMEMLRGRYIDARSQQMIREFGARMAQAHVYDKPAVLAEETAKLSRFVLSQQSKVVATEAQEGFVLSVEGYVQRAEEGQQFKGMDWGDNCSLLTNYTYGLHPGELATFAAGSGFGKSYFAATVAISNWKRGLCVCFYSLENGVPMTFDRMVCLVTGVDPDSYQRGTCTEEEVDRVFAYVADLPKDGKLHVIQQPPGKRTIEAIVRDAQIRGCQVLIIDQLTFVDPPDPKQPRDIQVRDTMHDLHTMIGEPGFRVPCLLLHQISRDGVRAAEKVGHYEIYHMANGAEVERTSDMVFAGYQTQEDRVEREALFQTLKVRRFAPKHFAMAWDLSTGNIRAKGERQLVQS